MLLLVAQKAGSFESQRFHANNSRLRTLKHRTLRPANPFQPGKLVQALDERTFSGYLLLSGGDAPG